MKPLLAVLTLLLAPTLFAQDADDPKTPPKKPEAKSPKEETEKKPEKNPQRD